MYHMFPFAYKQPCLMFFGLNMFKPRGSSTFLRYDAWFEIREELFSFMALYFTILNSPSSQGCIQLDCLDGCNTSFILFYSCDYQWENEPRKTTSNIKQKQLEWVAIYKQQNLPDWSLYQANSGYHNAEHHFLKQLSTWSGSKRKFWYSWKDINAYLMQEAK